MCKIISTDNVQFQEKQLYWIYQATYSSYDGDGVIADISSPSPFRIPAPSRQNRQSGGRCRPVRQNSVSLGAEPLANAPWSSDEPGWMHCKRRTEATTSRAEAAFDSAKTMPASIVYSCSHSAHTRYSSRTDRGLRLASEILVSLLRNIQLADKFLAYDLDIRGTSPQKATLDGHQGIKRIEASHRLRLDEEIILQLQQRQTNLSRGSVSLVRYANLQDGTVGIRSPSKMWGRFLGRIVSNEISSLRALKGSAMRSSIFHCP